jgi:hypothetical protein
VITFLGFVQVGLQGTNVHPDTIQLGSVTEIKGTDLPQIDLLIGGSPCQGFSFAGKQLNFDDPRSKLFFEFVRLIKEWFDKECHLADMEKDPEVGNSAYFVPVKRMTDLETILKAISN